MEQADLIWMNGELVAWEDAKVHVLTHGLHYGTGVFEGVRAYETPAGHGDLPPHDHLDRLFKSAELYYMPIPYTLEELRAGHARADRANGLELLHPPARVPRLRPDGPVPARPPVEVTIAVWQWGAYLGEEGKQNGVRARWRAGGGSRMTPDPARQGVGPVPEQGPGQDRGRQGGLRGGDPARLPRVRVRGHGREHLHRQGRRDRYAAAGQTGSSAGSAAWRSIADRQRPGLRGRRARHRPRRALSGRRGVPDRHGRRAGRGARDRRLAVGEHPARSPAQIQAIFEDACTGASERYAKWLDRVPAPHPVSMNSVVLYDTPSRRDAGRGDVGVRRGEGARRADPRRARRAR